MKNTLPLLKRLIPTLALAVMMLTPIWGWGQYAGTGTFTKITSVDALTDGYYVILNEADAFIMTNGRSGTATEGYFISASITPSSGTITDPSVNNVWKIEINGTGKTIYNESIAKYVGWSSGNSASIEDVSANTNRWTFTYVDSKFTVKNVAAIDRQLSYNNGSPRFAAYANAVQQELQLYKMGEAPTTPTIILNETALTDFTYEVGSGPSAEQTFTVSGSNLTENIGITPPTNYEISTGTGGSFSPTNPITLAQTSGTVAETTIYVRLKAGLSAGDFNGEVITATSTGATNKTVTCSGTVTAPPDPEPTNHATAFTAAVATPAYSSIDVTWADATGTTIPDGYVIKASDISYADIAEPVDGTEETAGALVKIVGPGVEVANFTGLNADQIYYFKIWPYTNSGTAIDYKTDESVPEATATTSVAPVITVVNFDDDSKWTAGSGAITGYQSDHTYIDGYFSSTGGPALRNTTSTQDGFPGALGTFSWRLENNASVEWIVSISSGGVSNFSMDIRRWDNNPSPAFTLDYSTDNGSIWNNVSTIDNDNLNNSSAWKTFSGTINSGINNILIRLKSTGTTERIMVDNFTWSPFESEPATSTYSNTGIWTNATNWSNGLPDEFTDAIINGNVIVDDASECNNLTISSAGTLTVVPDALLDVNGDLLIQSDGTGTGSFIGDAADYLIGGTTTVQRYLTGGWDSWDAGWHQISSPVAAQPISAFATTGVDNDYDFYGWEESTNMWMNYKDAGFSTWNGGTNFNVGQGYLVSYEAASTTQTFAGLLNTADVLKSNLSTNGGSDDGWHLLGNPFASALTWNETVNNHWALNNVSGNAKIWHEASKSYSDITANGIIPSAQGFMVQVSDAINSITIPADSRVHNATPFYKSSNAHLLLLATETEGGSAQESKIMVNPMATEGFDFDYDSRFLAGYAPTFYSVAGDELLSTNSFPSIDAGLVIPFGFVKNEASTFSIQLKESMEGRVVYLTDTKTGMVSNLTETPVYSFTSSDGDDANRFLLSFGTLGINNPEATDGVQVYAFGEVLYIGMSSKEAAQVNVYNLTGQLVMQGKTGGNTLTTFNASALGTGIYVVNVVMGNQVISRKVAIRN